MTADGRWCRLEDLIAVKHGFAFQGRYFRDEGPGDLLVTPGNFAAGGGFKTAKPKYYDGPIPDEYVLAPGDLIVTMTDLSKGSDTLGYPAIVPDAPSGVRYLHNQRIGKVLVKDRTALEPQYLYYLMCTAAYRQEILASASGTTVKHTSPTRVGRFRFQLPPLDEQQRVVGVLRSLDERIAVNREQRSTLQDLVQLLYASWIVSPSDGNDLPDGWSRIALGDPELLPLVSPGLAGADRRIQYIDTGNVDRIDVLGEVTVDRDSRPSRANMQPGADRVWFARMKDSPKYMWTMREDDGWWSSRALSTGFAGVAPSSRELCSLAYAFVSSERFQSLKDALATGTTMQAANNGALTRITMLLPPPPLAAAFDSVVRPMVAEMWVRWHHSRTLAELRNALLPSLIPAPRAPMDAA